MTTSSQQDLTDVELIQNYRQTGEQSTLNELLQRYYHLIYGACYKVLGDQEDAKDVCIEVCESLIVKLKEAEINYFSSWLYTVCHNRSVSYIRNRETRKKHEAEVEKSAELVVENQGLLRLSNDKSPQEGRVNAKDRLAEFMSQLPQAQRKCLQLFYFKSMSYAQIAKKTNSDQAQVKSHLQSGKRKLKLLYQAADQQSTDH